MTTRITWLGHANLLVETSGYRILIDPFVTDNPACPLKADQAQSDLILISHGHEDHVGDAVAIARRTGATVVANYEIGQWLQGAGGGLTKVHGMQHGGSLLFDGGIRVKLTLAFHGSTLPGGGYG